jgi:hypothetical protein
MSTTGTTLAKSNPNGACIEKGTWTTLPNPVPAATNFVFTPSSEGSMTFHLVVCSGDPGRTRPGLAVAGGMVSQIAKAVSPAVAPSFLYHLGDIAYTTSGHAMTGGLWNTQFYAQYTAYVDGNGPLPIFAIAGNHDGNAGKGSDTEIAHFEQNMCGTAGAVSPDNKTDTRTESTLPYPYWRLDTPLAWIIGLYTNVSNGGVLDDPKKHKHPKDGPQYKWLVDQLSYCKAQNASGTPRAILLALHYPPYNGTLDFHQRGNPTYGNDNDYKHAVPIGMVLQEAFAKSGQIPDAIFSAHAHLYQRITLSYNDSHGNPVQQVPCFVVGCGGHTQLELMATLCAGGTGTGFPAAPFNLFTKGTPPKGLSAPKNATVMIEFYADGTNQNNQPYGFLTVTLTPGDAATHPTLVCQFFITPCDSAGNAVNPGAVCLADFCTLDLTTHLLV